MGTSTKPVKVIGGGAFLTKDLKPAEIFTPEDITEEQRMFAQTAQEFLLKEVIPREDAIYAKDYAVQRQLMRKAGELGLLSIDIPEKHGGLGLNKVSSSIVGEQFAAQSSFAGTQSSHVNIGTLPIVFFGNELQKQKYLPRLASGEWIGAYALTEPQSGSDALAAKTKAVLSPDGRHYVLNGQKMWITNGGLADLFTVFAKVDGEKFTAFLVERGPGLTNGHEEKKLGIDGSSTTPLMLEDCKVPVENVLGEIGRGHKIAFNVLNIGRLKLGARSLGAMKVAFGQSAKYSRERHQFGQPISNFGLIKHKLAEMTILTYAGESILYRTAGLIDQALDDVDKDDPRELLKVLEQYAGECSIIKAWESEALAYIVDQEVQIFGGYGYSKDYPAERNYRDARIARIYEGTNEINRIVIASQLLRRARSGELPVLDIAASITASDSSSGGESQGDRSNTFADESALLKSAKNIAIASIYAADRAYGERVRDEQEVLGLIAEISMDVYAMESTLLRTVAIMEARGLDRATIQADICRVFIRDAASRIERAGAAIGSEVGDMGLAARFSVLSALNDRSPFKAIAARRRIADSTADAGRYNL